MTTTTRNIDAQKLKEQLDPEGVLRIIGYEKSNPKMSRGQLRDYCPIHGGDNQQSLAIDPEKKTFKCHSCGEAGTLIDLYGLSKGYDMKQDFPKVLEELATEVNFSGDAMGINSAAAGAITKRIPAQKEMKKELPDLLPVFENLKGAECDYAEKKKVKSYSPVKKTQDERGNPALAVPFYQDGKMTAINYVKQGRIKPFHTNSKYSGAFFLLGTLEVATEIYICEGYATAATIFEALGETTPVAMVGSKGNLAPVANAIHTKHSPLKRIVSLDLDAEAEIEKIEGDFWVTKPDFSRIEWEKKDEKDKDPTDFNDLVSMCGQSLTVVKEQLQAVRTMEEKSFVKELSAIVGEKYSQKLQIRTYNDFEEDHKNLFNISGLITGYCELDEKMKICIGDFVTVQGFSGHGKTTFMMQLAHQYLVVEENKASNPMCIFITYESMPIRVEQKLLNMISNELNEGTILKFDPDANGYLYPLEKDFPKTKALFNTLQKGRRFHVLKKVPYEKLEEMIAAYKKCYPSRTLVFFLDYIQKIDTSFKEDGWQQIKRLAYGLESLAVDQEVIIVTGSQVNNDRQAREGADIFNASTHNIDIFNHSHATIKSHRDLGKLYKERVGGKNVCSLGVRKQKYGPEFSLEEYFLLNGHHFTKKKENSQEGHTNSLSRENTQEHIPGNFNPFAK